MATINHLNRFIDCMGSDPTRTTLHSIAMLDDYLMSCDGHIGYAQRVDSGSIPAGRIDKSMLTKNAEIRITKTMVKIDGERVKFNPERPYTQSVIDGALLSANDLVTITDPKGLLKMLKKVSVITTTNPTNGRKSNRELLAMYIDRSNGAILVNGDGDFRDRITLAENVSKFIEFPKTAPKFDYLSFNPQYLIRILKALIPECDYITWNFSHANPNGAFIFHDAGETNMRELSQFYLLMPIRQ